MPALSSATRSGKPRRSGGPGAGTTFRCVSGGAARSPAMRICASAPPHQSMATRPPPTAARLRPGRYRPPPHSVLYVSLKVRLPGGYRSRYFPFPLARPPRSQKPGTALHRRLPKALRASDVCSKAQPRHRADTSHHLPRNKCRPQPGGLLRRRYIRARPARTERPPGRGRAGERRRRPSLTARRRRCSPPQGSPHAKDTEDTALPSPPSARRGRGGGTHPSPSRSPRCPAASPARPRLCLPRAAPAPPQSSTASSSRQRAGGGMAARSGEGQRAAPAAGRLWRPRWSGLRSACAGRRALLGPEEEEEEEGEGGEALRCPAPLGFSLLPSLPPSPASLLRGAPRAAPKMAAAPPAPRAVTKRRERTNGAGGGRGRAHVRAGEGREEPRRALRQRGRSCGAAGGDGLFAQLRGRPVVRSRAEHGWTRRAPLQQELKPRWSHLNAVSALLAAKKKGKKKRKRLRFH